MTIDEAIKHAREKSNECTECGKEHAQLVDWLEELKEYRLEFTEARQKDYETVYVQGQKDGYNNAIDEFVEKIILKYYGVNPDELCKRYGTIGIVETIKEIAEQIKGEYNT